MSEDNSSSWPDDEDPFSTIEEKVLQLNTTTFLIYTKNEKQIMEEVYAVSKDCTLFIIFPWIL